MASRARRMFWKDPRMWMCLSTTASPIPLRTFPQDQPKEDMRHTHGPGVQRPHVSARTIRVRVAFSMANLVRPPLPAMRPMARERCSPLRVFTDHAGPPAGAQLSQHRQVSPPPWRRQLGRATAVPSLISKLSMYKSSMRRSATASCSGWRAPCRRPCAFAGMSAGDARRRARACGRSAARPYVNVKAHHERAHKVGGLLQRARVLGKLGRLEGSTAVHAPQRSRFQRPCVAHAAPRPHSLQPYANLDTARLEVHAHLQLELLDERRVDLEPLLLERREPVRWHGDRARVPDIALRSRWVGGCAHGARTRGVSLAQCGRGATRAGRWRRTTSSEAETGGKLLRGITAAASSSVSIC